MYGIFVGLGALAVLLYCGCSRKWTRFPEADRELALIYGLIGMAVGAKLMWLATVLPQFLADIPRLFSDPVAFAQGYLLGGFVFYGGLLGVLLTWWIYCRVEKLPFYELCRSLMPVVPLFHAFGRVGCFFTGCCYGRAARGWGVVYSFSHIAPNGVALVPVQLMEAGAEAILFVRLVQMVRKGKDGWHMLCFWLAAYGLVRFVLEFFRGDTYRGILGPFSLAQWISMGVVALAVGLTAAGRSRKHAGSAAK